MPVPGIRFSALLGLLVLALLSLTPSSASAGEGQGSPALRQYSEEIPTADGTHTAGTGDRRGSFPLSARIEEELARIDENEALLLRATVGSPTFGAPQGAVRPSGGDMMENGVRFGSPRDALLESWQLGVLFALSALAATVFGEYRARRRRPGRS